MAATATSEQVQRFSLRAGDVLITKDSESWTDIAVPAVVAEDLTGVLCGYHLALIRPSEAALDGSFLARACSAIGPRDQFQISANGITRFGLTGDAIRTALFGVPPVCEQRAIAAFLDRETAKIDALVAKKERLIELLQEKRTALITRAVTKGLNPNGPMKDSGVALLGEIPAHWEVQRITMVARLESGHTPDKKVAEYWEGGGVPWLSLADTGRLREVDHVSETAAQTTLQGIAHSSARVLPAGTVAFSRDATIGACAILARPMAVSQHFIAWVCGPALTPEYLLFVLRSMTAELDRLTMGATIATIGMPDVKTLITPVPPHREQEAIVEFVKHERSKIDSLTEKVRQGIERLKEYRVALISAAVTGKIDVRDEVPDADLDRPHAG